MPVVDSTQPWIPPKRIAPSRIVAKTFSIWMRTLPQLLAIAALVHLPLLALKWWLHEAEEGTWRSVLFQSMPVIELTVLSRVIEGLAVLLVFLRLRGEPGDVGRSLRQGSRRLGTILAVSGITFLFLMAVPIGFFAYAHASAASTSRGFHTLGAVEIAIITLLIGWLIYSLVFFIPIPAAIVEGHGPFKAFNRSRVLTSGARGRIFWMFFLYGLATGIPARVLQAIIESIDDPTIALLASAVVDWFVASLTCVLPIVLYHDLRETKEGIGIEEILKVFE